MTKALYSLENEISIFSTIHGRRYHGYSFLTHEIVNFNTFQTAKAFPFTAVTTLRKIHVKPIFDL
jgi:hypothetical protein